MKPKQPKPLREEISDLTILIAIAREEGDEEEHEKVVNNILELFRQRIKSACEFYLKYKDDPELLWKEQLDYIEKLKVKRRLQQFLTNIREILSSKEEVSCVHGWDMYDKCKLLKEYNEWLFKLAFEVKEK